MEEYELHTLPNGLRIAHKQVNHTRIAHCGFILDIGSRDEGPAELGIAHFWEHMAFKGTKKRKSFHIINRLDSVGGELNAYTTKEKIAFYASALDIHFEKALELLADITFESIFPEKQIEKERQVILEEMAMYLDAPEDAIQDEFDTLIFPHHPLGENILGTKESVKAFKREDFQRFIFRHMNTQRIIFSSVSTLPFKKVVRLAEKYLNNVPAMSNQVSRVPFERFTPNHKVTHRQLTQAQCAMGGIAYPLNHPKRLAFITLINLLGGPGMNSRLNLSLREKYGYVYAIDANYTTYTDTGILGIFFGTDPSQIERSIRLVNKELQRLCETPLGSLQLHRTKEQLIGQLAMSEENNASMMLMMGRSLLDLNKVEPIETIFGKIRKLTAKELLEVANETLAPDQLSSLIYLPEES